MSKSYVSGESISGRRPINVISVGRHAVKGDIFRFTHESIQERNYMKSNQYKEENLTRHLLEKPHKKHS